MTPRVVRAVVVTVIAVAITAYFAQHVTAPPNADDGGIALGYIDRIAHGERVYFDYLDYYGPLTYLLPSLAYRLAGYKAIGVGLWMVLLKLVTVAVAYHSVRTLADRFYGVLAALGLAVLLGLPWPMFQIPYAHHLTLPLVLLTSALLLSPAGARSSSRLIGAAACTAAMLWMKVSIGAFVFAAIAFDLFYWPPGDVETTAPCRLTPGELAFRAAQLLGIAAYALVFQTFIREHFNGMYFLYLTLPLASMLVLTAHRVVKDLRARRSGRHAVRPWAIYVLSTLGFWAVVLLGYFGPSAALPYLSEQFTVLRYMKLLGDFPPIGVHGLFRGFGEYYWPQLPWLFSALFVAWLALAARRSEPDEGARARVVGLFVLVTLHNFVIYAVPDDAHIMQALLLVFPLCFVLFFHLEKLATPPLLVARVRTAVGIASALYASTLFFFVGRDALAWGPGDWGNPRLSHLPYHPEWSHFSNPVNPAVSDRVLDRQMDDAARQIDALTTDGEEILVLAPQHLLYFASNTVPALQRYGHLYYLLGHGRLERPHFEQLMPKESLQRLFESPPRVVVEITGKREMLDALPELQASLRGGRYRLVGRWGPLRVFLRSA